MKKTPDFVTWIWGFFVFESPFLLSILGFLVQFLVQFGWNLWKQWKL